MTDNPRRYLRPRTFRAGEQTGRHELDALLRDSWSIYEQAVAEATDGRKLAATVILFSGGNDSTTLGHMFRYVATHAAHANTGIGIEQTRDFVRQTCASWGLPLIEKRPRDGETYRDLVLGRVLARTGKNKGTPAYKGGFPGPAMHWLMYQRLKERRLEEVRNDLISNPREERLIFLAGRRAAESSRRKMLANKPPVERKGSTVWCSPLVNWTKLDLNLYRAAMRDLKTPVPRNEVADLLHMSGECLCGAFAHAGELDEIGEWFPEVREEIRALEREAEAAGMEHCRWGWGAGKEKPSQVGMLCSSCDDRFAFESTSSQVV